MTRKITLIIALLASSALLQAKVTLPHIFSDNMVLQQNTEVAIWGTAEKNAKVTITNTWSSAKVVVKAGKDGKWSAKMATPKAGGPYEFSVSDGEVLTLSNVLIGEVWLCSGQSNMEMPVRGYDTQPVAGSIEVIQCAKTSTPIRMCTVKRSVSNYPKDDCDCGWQEHTPQAVATCSAAAYFFGEYLQKFTDVPVGLLITDFGGTPVESWMSKEVLEEDGMAGLVKTDHLGTDKPSKYYDSGVLYNGMIRPLLPFTVKGAIWYQGESNRGRAEAYKKLFPRFVGMLRDEFQNPDMPFYYVQIAPYDYQDNPETAIWIQEVQEQCLDLIPNSGMARTLDIGCSYCIHPFDKKTVGHRLAYLAIQHTYGFDAVEADAPRVESIVFEDGKAVITFKGTERGVGPIRRDLEGFEMAGEDKVFYPCTGRQKSALVVEVRAPKEVPHPVAVRYAFHDNSKATLFNNFGIPVGPFRSDNW